MSKKVDQYAVFGNPISQSRSPEIHQQFAAQTDERLDYVRQLVELDGFTEQATLFFANEGKGLNITLPFKLDAYAYADQLSVRAKLAGAVNTLIATETGVHGDNTDGVGLLYDIQKNLAWSLEGKNVLLIGAGGAARGVIEPLLAAGTSAVTIVNRTSKKAVELAALFQTVAEQNNNVVHGCGFDGLSDSETPKQFDLIINASSSSISGNLPAIPESLLSRSLCYDMMYGSEPTAFLQWAAQNGAKGIADGLGMLVEQAAESFYLWRGKRPQTTVVINALRQSLK